MKGPVRIRRHPHLDAWEWWDSDDFWARFLGRIWSCCGLWFWCGREREQHWADTYHDACRKLLAHVRPQ